MAKTVSGGDEREPHKFENPYEVPSPKPAWDELARQRAIEFINLHFNDRRNSNPHPYIGDGKTSSMPVDKWYEDKNKKKPKGYS
jgi:hypothetical protein